MGKTLFTCLIVLCGGLATADGHVTIVTKAAIGQRQYNRTIYYTGQSSHALVDVAKMASVHPPLLLSSASHRLVTFSWDQYGHVKIRHNNSPNTAPYRVLTKKDTPGYEFRTFRDLGNDFFSIN